MKYRLLVSFGLWTAIAGVGWGQWLDFDLRRNIPWRIGDAPSPKTPTKIVAIWTDAVLHQPGKPPTRGFGGRLMFYGPDESSPIKVDGTLIVYAFDEEGRSPTDVKPDRKYVFPPDQFARHYSKSKLGHSYSVWIPWDEVGGPRKEISLIARFIPKNGAAIVSGQSRQILPGVPPAEETDHAAAQPAAGAGTRQNTASNRPAPGPAWLQEPGPSPAMPLGSGRGPSLSPKGLGGQVDRYGLDTIGRTTGMSGGGTGGPMGPSSGVVPEAPVVPPPRNSPQQVSPGQLGPPGGNPLRPTGYYEGPSAGQVQPAGAETFASGPMPLGTGQSASITSPNPSATGPNPWATGQPSSRPVRMRTATIPVPAPLIRPSNPSARTWEASSASYEAEVSEAGTYGPAVRHRPAPAPVPNNPGFAPNPYGRVVATETGSGWQSAQTMSPPMVGSPPTGGSRSAPGAFSYGTLRDTASGTTCQIPADAATASAQPQSQPNRGTSGRPPVRSGPIGPQAPAGPIGPQARDRAALPPLP